MDSITHIALGATLAYACFAPKAGGLALAAGAIAASLPDLDVFIRTGDPITDRMLHRHFTHALVMVPVIAAITTGLLMLVPKARPLWRPLLGAAAVAALSHGLLDAATSYGTLLLWPFSAARISWDWIAIIDPLFTLPLLIAMFIAIKTRTRRPIAIGLTIAAAYMVLAVVQHDRAAGVQRQLAAQRGHAAITNARVMPQLGSILVYRAMYEHDRRIYADGIRVPLLSAAGVMRGASVQRAVVEDIRPFPADERAQYAFDQLAWFSQEYIARSPRDPLLFGDMRYSSELAGFAPLWGIQIEHIHDPAWRMFTRDLRNRSIGRLFRHIISPKGFEPLHGVPVELRHSGDGGKVTPSGRPVPS